MQRLQSIFNCRLMAAFIFFTRLPFWRLANVDARHFERVVPLWPVVGWLTGGLMALTLYLAILLGFSIGTAVLLALISRVLVTGALHEDGLADFFDGFGGGTTRERTLEIMKDSHIGTYGVLGLALYYLLLWNLLVQLFCMGAHPLLLLVVDVACKALGSSIIYFLPYARNAAQSKAGIVYQKTKVCEVLTTVVVGLLPLVLYWQTSLALAFLVCTVFCAGLFAYMKHRIQGYTGDCCGATFLLTELVFYIFSVVCRV